MQKIVKSAVLTVLCIFAFSVSAAADVRVTVNSEPVEFDMAPVIKNGRTLVPIRAAAEKMGLKVTWEQETMTASLINHEKTVQLTVGSNVLVDNGTEQILDTAPELINDRVCLPLRAAVEAFGADVAWDGEQQLVSVEAPDTNKLIKYKGTFGENEISCFYSDSIFKNINGMNHKLAVLSSVAVLAAENDETVTSFLESCGFGNIKTYNYDKDSALKENYLHKSDFALGVKEINGMTVTAVIIRGTSGNEWYSNFDIYGDNRESNVHYGFGTAAEEIVNTVNEYAPDGSYIWLCGHSRGGAAANIAAEALYKEGKHLSAYTFAAPNTVKKSVADSSVPVYNFVSNDDIIAKIPPSGENWNYTKHGDTIILDNYNRDKMQVRFAELTSRNYNAIKSEDVRAAEKLIENIAADIGEYYNSETGGYTPYGFFTECVVPMLTGTSYRGLIMMMDSVYGELMRFFVLHSGGEAAYKYKDFITIEAYDDCNGIVYEHCAEAYLSKLMFWEGNE